MSTTYAFHHLKNGHKRDIPLSLRWEVHGDPISDDYLPEDKSPAELFRMWRDRYGVDREAAEKWGTGAVSVYWSVVGPGTHEAAPFQLTSDDLKLDDFLSYYSWPVDTSTGERLRWADLPVLDKRWNDQQADKGGFIQEHTGWKPSPLQPFVYLPQLLAMIGERP